MCHFLPGVHYFLVLCLECLIYVCYYLYFRHYGRGLVLPPSSYLCFEELSFSFCFLTVLSRPQGGREYFSTLGISHIIATTFQPYVWTFTWTTPNTNTHLTHTSLHAQPVSSIIPTTFILTRASVLQGANGRERQTTTLSRTGCVAGLSPKHIRPQTTHTLQLL